MGDEVDGIVARHVLLLQEIGGVRFTLGKDGDKDVCPRHLGPTRALNVDGGALDHALKGGCGHGFGPIDIGHEVGKLLVDEFDKSLSQFLGINRAGFHDTGRIRFIDQGQ